VHIKVINPFLQLVRPMAEGHQELWIGAYRQKNNTTVSSISATPLTSQSTPPLQQTRASSNYWKPGSN